MQIDLSKSSSAPTSIVPDSANPLRSTGSSLLPMKIGEEALAQITKIAAVTKQQIAAIESKVAQSLSQNTEKNTQKNKASHYQGKTLIENITSTGLKSFARDISLHLAELKVNDKTFTILTNLVLKKQDTLSIRINQGGQLEILNKSAAPYKAGSATQASAIEPTSKDKHNSGLIALSPEVKLEIQKTLREILPHHDKPDLVKNLNSINVLINEIPKSKATVNIINLLNTIKQSSIEVNTTPKANDIKMAFMNSGNFLEGKLLHDYSTIGKNLKNMPEHKVKAIPDTKIKLTPATIKNPITLDLKANLLKLIGATSAVIVSTKNANVNDNLLLSNQTNVSITTDASKHAFTDSSALGASVIKQSLIVPTATPNQEAIAQTQAENQAIKSLMGTTKPPERAATNIIKPDASTLKIPPFILQFLGSHTTKSQSIRESKILQTQLLVLVHQLSLANLSKIRLNQIRPETHTKGSSDQSVTSANTFNFDVPIRHDGTLHNAHIEIDADGDSYTQTDDNEKKNKCWNIKLNISTEEIGHIYIHLTFLNDNLSMKLWADNVGALADAKEKFSAIKDNLTAQGIQVDNIQYFSGKPNDTENTINYSLVDIKT